MSNSCCVEPSVPLGPRCEGDFRGQWSNKTLSAGRVHPRPKDVPGRRLAQAAFASVYRPDSALLAQAPFLSGCSVSADGATLTLRFDAAALKGERMTVSKPPLARPLNLSAENTALYVLPAPAQLDLAAVAANHHNQTQQGYRGPYSSGNEFGVEGWVAVMPSAGAAPNEVSVDLAPLRGAAPSAIRYGSGAGSYGAAVGNALVCCGPLQDIALSPCPPASCPLKSSALAMAGSTELPASPFVAAIVGGRCVCAAPTDCSS